MTLNIEDILHKRKIESARIEFKEGWNPDKIYRTICAFANDFDNIGGGYIIVGVEENNGVALRPAKGLPLESLDRIQKEMVGYNNKISPYYMPRVSVEKVDGNYVLVIWVPPGDNRPYEVYENVTSRHSPSRIYIRNGSTTQVARGEVLHELREMTNRIPFDERVNQQMKLEDVAPLLVQDYLRKVGSSLYHKLTTDNLAEILDQMNLYAGPSENRMLKNITAMMFCEHPEQFFPYTQVDIVTFPEGRVKNPNNFSEVSFTGPIPQLIGMVMDYLKTIVIREHVVKIPGRTESRRFFNYPYQALEEAVVNSLYHRDYQEREPVEITVEPDKISILSYSGPDKSISEKSLREGKLLRTRRYRNRRLGDFLKELNLTEGRSTGIPTIQEELEKNGSAAATFETDPGRTFFMVDIPCHPEAVDDIKKNESEYGGYQQAFTDDIILTFSRLDDVPTLPDTEGLITDCLASIWSNNQPEQLGARLGTQLGESIKKITNPLFDKILQYAIQPRSARELMDQVGVKNHSFNRAKYIHSLTKYGFLTNTEKSKNSSIQKYQTTEAGKRLLNLTNNLPPQ